MDPIFSQLITATVVMGLWSTMYKPNPLFKVIQTIIVGFASAHAVLAAITNIDRYCRIPITQGDYIIWLAVVWGVCHYAYFSSRLRGIYRICMFLTVSISLGQTLPSSLDSFLRMMSNWVGLAFSSDPLMWIFMIMFYLLLMYFLYWKRFDDVVGKTKWFSQLRVIASFALLAYVGYACGINFLQWLILAVGLTADIETNVGIYVPIIIGLFIAIDIVIGLRTIMGSKTVTKTTDADKKVE